MRSLIYCWHNLMFKEAYVTSFFSRTHFSNSVIISLSVQLIHRMELSNNSTNLIISFHVTSPEFRGIIKPSLVDWEQGLHLHSSHVFSSFFLKTPAVIFTVTKQGFDYTRVFVRCSTAGWWTCFSSCACPLMDWFQSISETSSLEYREKRMYTV